MGREADSTIKGFMYQFNLSLNEILKSDSESIMLEGIIEDIDKISLSGVTAIQCKYHESVDAFNWSKVYKPILQMLKTYTEISVSNIKFVLHAFFPGKELEKRLFWGDGGLKVPSTPVFSLTVKQNLSGNQKSADYPYQAL